MLNNTDPKEFEAWYICLKLLTASNAQKVKKWLTELDRLTESNHKDCFIDLKNYCRYYALHCDINE